VVSLGLAVGLLGCRSLSTGDGGAERLRGIQLPAYVPGTTDSTTIPLRVMSYNVRYNNPDDSAWGERGPQVASMIRFHEPAVVGTQEGQLHQLMDLTEQLDHYQRVGVGRDQSGGGEFSALLYQASRLELLEYDTFWLADTPREPGSQGWDGAFPRIATWARFRDRLTGDVFLLMNTHFDHRGGTARIESARLLQQRMSELSGGTPVVLMGDFNSEPEDEPIRLLTAEDAAVSLQDARLTSESTPHGPESTYNAFGFSVEEGRRIDYVFTSPEVRVLRHGHLSARWGRTFPSDHLPVVADLVF
jgi:endonuclease/exonuclease/phosphatase family metal-dependent hydrolase